MSDIQEAQDWLRTVRTNKRHTVKNEHIKTYLERVISTTEKALAVYAAFEDAREVLEGMVWRDIESAPYGTAHPYSEFDEKSKFVLVKTPHHVSVAYFQHEEGSRTSALECISEDGHYIPDAKFWMPLPSDTDKIRKLLEAGK